MLKLTRAIPLAVAVAAIAAAPAAAKHNKRPSHRTDVAAQVAPPRMPSFGDAVQQYAWGHTGAGPATATTFLLPTRAAVDNYNAGSPTAVAARNDLSAARAATAGYHRLAAAEHDGYGLFKDAAGIACIDNPGVGGMGVHYVKAAQIGRASCRERV